MKKKLTGLITCTFLFTGFSTASAETKDVKNCIDFADNQQELMQFWYTNGYSASNDPHNLDGDRDGLPCEVPQSEYDSFVESQESSSSQTVTNESSSTTVTNNTNNTAVTSETNQTETSSTTATSQTGQGEQMPDTASNGLLFTLLSAGLVMAGSFLLYCSKKNHA